MQRQSKAIAGELIEITLDEAMGLFFEKHAQYFARPLETLKKLHLIATNLDVVYLHDINNQILVNYIQKRKLKVTNSTINRELVIISSLLSKCRSWGYLSPELHPTSLRLREPAENVKYLKDWDIAEKIINNAADHLKPIIYTALYTGLRRGNILALKWKDIDFTNHVISVKVKDKNKEGGKNLTIPMIDKLEKILLSLPKINENVFNYKDRPIKDIKHSWHSIFYNNKGCLKDPSLPYVNFHTLRHTAATWILKKTNNLKITQEILGHANISTTLKYAHIMSEEKMKALNAVFN